MSSLRDSEEWVGPRQERGDGVGRHDAEPSPLGLRLKSVTAVGAITWGGGKRDAIIAAKAPFLLCRVRIPGSLAEEVDCPVRRRLCRRGLTNETSDARGGSAAGCLYHTACHRR